MRLRRRWLVMRNWQGNASMMVPQPIDRRFWTLAGAERAALRLNRRAAKWGGWYTVAVGGDRPVTDKGSEARRGGGS